MSVLFQNVSVHNGALRNGSPMQLSERLDGILAMGFRPTKVIYIVGNDHVSFTGGDNFAFEEYLRKWKEETKSLVANIIS